MKKNLLKWLFTLCVFSLFSVLNAGEVESYGPHGKNQFKEASDRILVKFNSGISFETKLQILSKESNILPLSKDDVLPAPDVSIVRTKNLSDSERTALLERLQQVPSVEYANPFVIYSDGTYQGIQDRIIIRLKSQKDLIKISDMAVEFNLTIQEKNEFDSFVYVLKTSKQTGANALEIANKIHEKGVFEYAEPDFLLLLNRFSTNDPLLPNQWSLNNTGSSAQYNGTAGADMDIFNAWGITSGSSTIKVAIIDEGVDLNHPDLQANLLPGYDATGLGSNGGPSGDDAHGTACAGIVAAVGNNNLGVSGVAYNCKIIPVRIAYSNTSGNWVTSNTWIGNSLNWAWQNGEADVLSNSWGGGSSSSTINNAITGAVNNGRGGLGSPVLFAAGNSNGANSYPATEVNTISVIAMSMCYQRKSPSSCDGETFWGSNYGNGADVAAPGVKIATTDISGTSGYSSGDYTGTFNGTSSACPNAAGVMALILSASPTLSQTQARFTLESTCEKVGGYTYNSNVSGQPNGTWSNDLGYGLVNAFQALQSITPQAQTDAGISLINAPDGSYCISTLSPSVTLKNYGTNALTSVIINYQIGSNPVQTYQWSGNLASTNSTVVTLPSQNFQNGSFSFLAYTSSPNGTSDELTTNDSRTSSFTIANNPLTLTIVLDNYPSETSWSILDGSSNIVASGGTYSGSAQGSTVIENLCLSDGCYTFIMNDSYGDGICCAYGNGSYTLTKDSDGSVLASGGAFTFSESTGFCVQESSPLSGNVVSTTNVSCFNGNNGSAEVEAQGGTSPYFYSWSSGQNTAAVSNLAAGTYTVSITDNAGSQVNVQVTITQPSLLSANASSQSATCFGSSNGSVSLSVSGGTAPYSYSWSNGSSSQNLNGVGSGSYSIVVSDANGCSTNASANVSQPANISASASSTDASCNGANDGSVSLSVSGGTTPYSYSWSNGASSQNLSNVGGGSYSVVVTDANGCNANTSVNVNTGDTPVQPELACYETASFNTTTCSWEVSGDMPAQPAIACYETASFNTTTCSWEVRGDMPTQPQIACYETASSIRQLALGKWQSMPDQASNCLL